MLRAGIIGVNFGAQVHLPAIAALSGVEVVALADGGSGRAALVAREFAPNAAAFTDGVSLIENADLDLVIVATPPAAQARMVLAAIEAGKPVLCEKPFGASLDEAERMALRATQACIVNAIGFQFRYDAGLRRAIEVVQSGAIGSVHRIDVAWLTSGGRAGDRQWSWRHDTHEGGGVLTEFCTHVLDYLVLIAGSLVDAVSMTTETVVTKRPAGKDRRDVVAPDSVEMLVQLGSTVAHVSVSNAEPIALGHRIEVHGTGGRLTLHHRPPFRDSDISLRLETAKGESVVEMREPAGNVAEDSRVPATRDLLTDFITTICGGEAPLLPDFAAGLAARRAVALAEASHTR